MRLFGIVSCLLALGMTSYSALRYQAPKIQADIDARAKGAIAKVATHPVEVVTSGRHVTLRGLVVDQEERQRLLAAARDVAGVLGPLDQLELLPTASPYRFEATKTGDGKVMVEGAAPDAEIRASLNADAAAIFGDQVDITIALAAGAPEGDWRGIVGSGMDALATVSRGRLSIVDQAVTLEGEVETEADAEAIAMFAESAPPGFVWTNDLNVRRPVVEPFSFSARKDEVGSLSLKGVAPDDVVRDALIEQAKAAAGDQPLVADIQVADGMPDAEWPILVGTGIAAIAYMKAGEFQVVDNRLTLTGDVATEADLAVIREIAGEAVGEDRWPQALRVRRPPVRTYSVTVDKALDGVWFLTGSAPDAETRDRFIAGVQEIAGDDRVASEMELVEGTPADDWPSFVTGRLAALDAVRSGRLAIDDDRVHLTGVVDTPEDVLVVKDRLAAIDDGMTIELHPVDPRPAAAFDLLLSPDDGVTISGTLPQGLGRDQALKALGVTAFSGDLADDGRGDASAWREDLTAIGSYLTAFEYARITLDRQTASVEGKVYGIDEVKQVREGLDEALGAHRTVRIDVKASGTAYAEGTRRTNPLTYVEEEYHRGYWLPVVADTVGLGTCSKRSSEILAKDKITFRRGEATLDRRARKVIDELAAVALKCLKNGDLALEIGGHTDGRGAESMNQKLSQDRAERVLRALKDRGVDEAALIATGFGESRPIADNATDDGRARNRRITFQWRRLRADG